MAETYQEKTEQPTQKRLDEARKKGQVAQSKELSTCMMILFSTIFLYFATSYGFQEMFKVYMTYVKSVDTEISVSNVFDILSFGAYKWFWMVAPVFGLLTALAVFGSVGQIGFMWSAESIQLKAENLNPLNGIKRLFSKRSFVEVLKALVKIALLACISYSVISKELPNLLSLSDRGPAAIVTYLGRTAFQLALKVGITFLFIAGLDFLYQKWQQKKDLMMTQQEIKEEYKEREGSPLIKSRIRSLQREMARRRMIEDVKTADVVVTNPNSFAVALKYRIREMPAPKIVAKGAGFVADKIKGVAKLHGVPIMENRPLARALFYSIRIGEYVPEKFYMIVAELLAQVYRQRKIVRL
jgi:flagellar biosynthesis protein FlhB